MMGGGPEGGPGGMRGGPGLRQGPGPVTERRSVGFRAIASLTVPAYRLYFLFVLGQMGAMNMQMMARSWYVYELSKTPGTNDGSVTMLGAVALANGLPMLTLSLFGGSAGGSSAEEAGAHRRADHVDGHHGRRGNVHHAWFDHRMAPAYCVVPAGNRDGADDACEAGDHPGVGERKHDYERGGAKRRGDESAAPDGPRAGGIPDRIVGHRRRVLHHGAAVRLRSFLILMGVPLTGAVALRGSGMLKQVGGGPLVCQT